MHKVLVRRPRIGDTIDEGRFGSSRVVAVRQQGRSLLVRDRIDRVHLVSRANTGWWTLIPISLGKSAEHIARCEAAAEFRRRTGVTVVGVRAGRFRLDTVAS